MAQNIPQVYTTIYTYIYIYIYIYAASSSDNIVQRKRLTSTRSGPSAPGEKLNTRVVATSRGKTLHARTYSSCKVQCSCSESLVRGLLAPLLFALGALQLPQAVPRSGGSGLKKWLLRRQRLRRRGGAAGPVLRTESITSTEIG